jgi:hypothetical protein
MARCRVRFLAQRPLQRYRRAADLHRPLKILRELGADVVGLHATREGRTPARSSKLCATGEARVSLLIPVPGPERPHVSEERRTESSSWHAARPAPCWRTTRLASYDPASRSRRCSALGRRPGWLNLEDDRGIRSAGSCRRRRLREIGLTATSTYIRRSPQPGPPCTVLAARELRVEPRARPYLIGMPPNAMLAARAELRTHDAPEGLFPLWAELDGVDADGCSRAGRLGHVREGHRLAVAGHPSRLAYASCRSTDRRGATVNGAAAAV